MLLSEFDEMEFNLIAGLDLPDSIFEEGSVNIKRGRPTIPSYCEICNIILESGRDKFRHNQSKFHKDNMKRSIEVVEADDANYLSKKSNWETMAEKSIELKGDLSFLTVRDAKKDEEFFNRYCDEISSIQRLVY